MNKGQIEFAIRDRLTFRWKRRCQDEDAAPIFLIAIKQLPGPDFGTPVVVTVEGMPNEELAVLLMGIAKKLMEESR